MVGFSFSIVTCWTALGGVLTVGITSGGPPVMVYSWLGVSAFSLLVAYSFAEMCSAYPSAGGQYSWMAILAPPRIARLLSYVTGWFMLTGIIAMGATNNFIGANFVLGMANLNNPNYVIERWHTVLVTYLIALVAAASNVTLSRHFEKLSTSTGVPLIQILYDSTGSIGAPTWLATMIAVIVLVCANSLMAEGSHSLYAFARDRGLPFPSLFSAVDKRTHVPIYSILLCTGVQMALNSIYFASYEGFSTVISIATFGFYLSYAMPLFVRLLLYFTTGRHATIHGTSYSLGRWGLWINAGGLLFLLFACVDFNFPPGRPRYRR
ncbi:hypothetical protein H2198_008225 [Neophaeococcomyces mojaviensis]|uniref:Uncharacterized protein n=1 Tax=Neophaeococcomyces mojaviensis TaxID=3383035 RepID=A0ACC2ZXQ0_9EURO|nr:hypothetical protein H2198_008225 [Knufia sp. JES_112]